MKRNDEKKRWHFVDEAGDPAFYGKGKKIIVGTPGCSHTFSIGFLCAFDPEHIRVGLRNVRAAIAEDRYLKGVSSIKKTLTAFHAKNDCPEVKQLVFKALEKMEFRVNVIVARKLPHLFRDQFGESQNKFYDFLVDRLFWNQMHVYSENAIVFSRRGTVPRTIALREAVESAVCRFRKEHLEARETKITIDIRGASEDFALQAADYALWALQRAYEMGEMRYFEFLRDKYSFICDIYDFAKRKTGKSTERHCYNRYDNPFDIGKASPLS